MLRVSIESRPHADGRRRLAGCCCNRTAAIHRRDRLIPRSRSANAAGFPAVDPDVARFENSGTRSEARARAVGGSPSRPFDVSRQEFSLAVGNPPHLRSSSARREGKMRRGTHHLRQHREVRVLSFQLQPRRDSGRLRGPVGGAPPSRTPDPPPVAQSRDRHVPSIRARVRARGSDGHAAAAAQSTGRDSLRIVPAARRVLRRDHRRQHARRRHLGIDDARGSEPGRHDEFHGARARTIFHLGNARSADAVVTPHRAMANGFALAAVGAALALQGLAIYYPPLASVLHTYPPSVSDWLVIAPLSLMAALVGQTIKVFRQR